LVLIVLPFQEELWRQAYDKLARENEKLRGEGSEAALAAQWRQRYVTV
jgi:hypothetical protein